MTETSQSEPEAIAVELSKTTGALFKVLKPTPKFPPTTGKVDWLVGCVDLENASKAFHVDSVWKEHGDVFIETESIGSTGEWVEWDYGEKAVGELLKMDLSKFDDPGLRKQFGKRFPRVARRLELSERVLAGLSSKHRTSLRIRYDGGKGGAVLYLQSKSQAGDVDSEISQIRKGAAALKAAIKEIEKLQENDDINVDSLRRRLL